MVNENKKDTITQFKLIITECKKTFIDKYKEYGPSWRLFRPTSITDQVFIKLLRIRSIEEKKTHKIDDPIELEWIGIINYSIVSIWLLKSTDAEYRIPTSNDELEYTEKVYDQIIKEVEVLLTNKNHDYDEAWRNLRPTSLTDLCLVKICRIKQIEDCPEKESRIESIISNYMDIINYAIFACILLRSE
jgi:hypothetical protein